MTLVPLGNVAVHTGVVQSMPGGSLVTLPIVALGREASFTVSATVGMNMALTVCGPFIATVQVAVLLDWQAPSQAENTLP